MRKAGGIVALIAGIFGLIDAAITLFVGDAIRAVTASVDPNNTVTPLGWGDVLFSLLVIVLGAVAIYAKGRVPGIILVVSSILGAVLSGSFVAMCMVVALVGGVLATFGNNARTASA